MQNGPLSPASNFESISIPRPKYRDQHHQRAEHAQSPVYASQRHRTYISETRIQEADIIERISDQFRFLEERDNTFPVITNNPIGQYKQKQSYNKYIFACLAVIQIIVAVILLIFACFRHFQLFGRPEAKVLLDFVKVEDYVASNQDGTDLIAIKLGTSIFLPAILQLLAGFTGLYHLRIRPPKALYILNIIFCSLAILFWFRPIVYAVFELNLRNVQLRNGSNETNHWLISIALFLISLDILIINSVLLIRANTCLSSSIRTPNHILDVHVSMLAIFMSVLCIVCSIYAVAYTMTNVSGWGQEDHNIASLYGFGLRELIISTYIFLITIYTCSSVVIRRKNMRQSALTLQIVGLVCLFYELLNEDRLLAASHNIRVMFTQGISDPINPEIILLLYTFIVLLTIILSIQIFSTALNVFEAPVCNVYSPTTSNIQPVSQVVHSSL
ncbi:hypothetical protein M3Y97_00839900 [Aphelenchoides bicaudatus]|nr:hypothetical protein M3Y97_00839900 [Aphelenchoides bicaudatus]